MVWPHVNMRPYGQPIADEVAETLEIIPKTFFNAPEFCPWDLGTCIYSTQSNYIYTL